MSEQSFQPRTINITQLLTDSDALYQIPQYQRHYKWTDEHVEKLWDDLYEAYSNEPKRNYFLGSIVTAKPTGKSLYKDIVDGQQRLTTLMILCCVIRDLHPKINDDSTDALSVSSEVIQNSIFLYGNKNKPRLLTHNSAKTDFNNNIIEIGITKKHNKPSPTEMNKALQKNNFINSAVILRKKLKELKFNDVQNFVNFIFNQVKIIRIDCKDVHFAIKLFQVINARGMDLASADLIKSFLLGKMEDSKKDSDLLSHQKHFELDWREIERNVENSDINNIDDLFTFYTYYELATNPKKSIYEELQTVFNKSKKDSNKFIGEVKRFSDNYHNEIYINPDKSIYALRYLPWNIHWRSIILAGLQNEYPDISRLIKILSRFYYLYWIGGFTLSKVKHPSFNIIKQVKELTPIDDISSSIEEFIINDEVIRYAIAQLTSDNIAVERWCKPLLLLIEYAQLEEDRFQSFISLKEVQLEHVMPTNSKKNWPHITDKEKEYLNSAGNLTLLTGKRNNAAGNKPFHEKMKIYKGDEHTKTNSFNISRYIAERQYGQQWDKNAMKTRKDWFIKEVSTVLGIKINPESDS